jgi:hypothetical protein
LFLCGLIWLAGYAAFQCFAACMAGSSLVGLSSHIAAQRHYGILSWIWFAVTLTAVIAFVVFLIAVRRPSAPLPPLS